jgi:2-keto-4-pentenoate hydratase
VTSIVTTPTALEVEAAERLRTASLTGVPCAPVRDLIGEHDQEAAYRVQAINLGLAVAAGARIVGRKIGLTSKAVQQQLGVTTPDVGTLFADMWCEEGLPIPLGQIMQPKIEAEIALVLGRDLTLEQPTAIDVVRAVELAVPSFEIVGSRIEDWDIRIADTIADNASSGAFVLGGPYRSIEGLDLTTVSMRVESEGEVLASGTGRDCLGNPLNAVVWVARRLALTAEPLRAGDVVLTGSLGSLVTVDGPGEYVADFGDFGRVLAVFE